MVFVILKNVQLLVFVFQGSVIKLILIVITLFGWTCTHDINSVQTIKSEQGIRAQLIRRKLTHKLKYHQNCFVWFSYTQLKVNMQRVITGRTSIISIHSDPQRKKIIFNLSSFLLSQGHGSVLWVASLVFVFFELNIWSMTRCGVVQLSASGF